MPDIDAQIAAINRQNEDSDLDAQISHHVQDNGDNSLVHSMLQIGKGAVGAFGDVGNYVDNLAAHPAMQSLMYLAASPRDAIRKYEGKDVAPFPFSANEYLGSLQTPPRFIGEPLGIKPNAQQMPSNDLALARLGIANPSLGDAVPSLKGTPWDISALGTPANLLSSTFNVLGAGGKAAANAERAAEPAMEFASGVRRPVPISAETGAMPVQDFPPSPEQAPPKGRFGKYSAEYPQGPEPEGPQGLLPGFAKPQLPYTDSVQGLPGTMALGAPPRNVIPSTGTIPAGISRELTVPGPNPIPIRDVGGNGLPGQDSNGQAAIPWDAKPSPGSTGQNPYEELIGEQNLGPNMLDRLKQLGAWAISPVSSPTKSIAGTVHDWTLPTGPSSVPMDGAGQFIRDLSPTGNPMAAKTASGNMKAAEDAFLANVAPEDAQAAAKNSARNLNSVKLPPTYLGREQDAANLGSLADTLYEATPEGYAPKSNALDLKGSALSLKKGANLFPGGPAEQAAISEGHNLMGRLGASSEDPIAMESLDTRIPQMQNVRPFPPPTGNVKSVWDIPRAISRVANQAVVSPGAALVSNGMANPWTGVIPDHIARSLTDSYLNQPWRDQRNNGGQ